MLPSNPKLILYWVPFFSRSRILISAQRYNKAIPDSRYRQVDHEPLFTCHSIKSGHSYNLEVRLMVPVTVMISSNNSAQANSVCEPRRSTTNLHFDRLIEDSTKFPANPGYQPGLCRCRPFGASILLQPEKGYHLITAMTLNINLAWSIRPYGVQLYVVLLTH